jgi:hypothetical protein
MHSPVLRSAGGQPICRQIWQACTHARQHLAAAISVPVIGKPDSQENQSLARTPIDDRSVDVKSFAEEAAQSLQLRVLRLGLLQDRDVGIGVFPKRKKSLVSVTVEPGGQFAYVGLDGNQ